MSQAKFQEYVAEVKHLGRPSKPVIARPIGDDQYEIVDGEHAWRAAKEAGLNEISCEIDDLDDFEAARQCYKRNRGGKDNPVKLGRMFLQMKKHRKLSNRKLAVEINVPESTIRTRINYAKAADLRSGYAKAKGDKEIAQLKVLQVDMYLHLADEMRNVWLDAGADIGALEKFFKHDVVSEVVDPLRKAQLFWLLDGDWIRFPQSLEYALRLANWRARHEQLDGVDAYLHSVAEMRLPAEVLDCVPCQLLDDGLSAKSVLSPEAWKTILVNANDRTSNDAGLLAAVESYVRVAVRDAGFDLGAICGPEIAEMQQLLTSAPPAIRECEFLSLSERHQLFTIAVDGVPVEHVHAA